MFRTNRSTLADATPQPRTLSPRMAAAREALGPYVDSAREVVTPHLDVARDRLAPAVDAALDTTRQVANERLLPAAEAARDRLAPVVNRATDTILDAVVPAVTAAASAAYEGATPAGRAALRGGDAAVSAIRAGAPDARRNWPTSLALVLFGVVIGALIGMRSRRRAPEPPWMPPAAVPGPGVMELDIVEEADAAPPAPVDLSEAEATRWEQ